MNYNIIIEHYEKCLEKHGDNHLGVDWPKSDDANKRYQIMLDLIPNYQQLEKKVSLLDFGCGAAHLYEYILNNNIPNIDYCGLDLSEKFITLCRKKFPEIPFFKTDILKNDNAIPNYEYIVLNGVFTEKRTLTFAEMIDYFKLMIEKIFSHATKGIAFNVMSKHVDWERDDLFHLSFDTLADFLCKKISRNFIIRNDYKLYEYTVYLYK